MTDVAGAVPNRYIWRAFGKQLSANEAEPNAIRFCGEAAFYSDSEPPSVMYARERYLASDGHWLSAERSVESRKAASYALAENSPVSETLSARLAHQRLALADSIGLRESLEVIPTNKPELDEKKCGEVARTSWNVRLGRIEVSPRRYYTAPCDGHLIAHVTATCKVGDCVTGRFGGASRWEFTEYWYAAAIRQGKKVPAEGFTHVAQFRTAKDSVGYYFLEATFRFYCIEPLGQKVGDAVAGAAIGTGELVDWGPGTYGKLCGTETFGSKSTSRMPKFWALPPLAGPATVRFQVEWNCCPCRDVVRASAHPRRKGEQGDSGSSENQ